MNFYLLNSRNKNASKIQNIIESDFSNSLVGTSSNIDDAYDDLLQLRVDILIIACSDDLSFGIDLIKKLISVRIKPRFIMIGPSETNAISKEEAYNVGIDFYLEPPFNSVEFKHIVRLVAYHCQLLSKLSEIYKITSGINTPFNQPQSRHRQQTDKINSILRFLGIASETGNDDIIKIMRIMVDQNISFSSIDFMRDLSLDERGKKVVFQRIRRALRVGINNLAGMCIEYPENEILLEYANCLFEYQNIYIEIQKLRGIDIHRGQISIQHFFDGLLQESNNDNLK